MTDLDGEMMLLRERNDTALSNGDAIVLDSAVVVRQGARILGPVSLRLAESRIGVVGRNGSGKTTLARLICGLVEAESGTARVFGIDAFRNRPAAIRAVGILFQNPDHQIIFPTVGEEIAFGLSQLGTSKADAAKEVGRVLARFGRPHWADRPIHTLSQGQRHLVCLMSVLAMEPRLILLDEPFAGLDIPTARTLGRYLEALDQRIVHIAHDPAMLTDCDRVIWLEDGEVALDGPPEQVLPTYRTAMETDDDRSDLSD